MARNFLTGDSITFSPGSLSGSTLALTVLQVIRPIDTAGGPIINDDADYVGGSATGTSSWSLFSFSGNMATTSSSSPFGPIGSNMNVWYVYGYSKPSGSAQIKYHLATVGGSYTHTGGSTNANGSGGTNSLIVGAGLIRGHAKFQCAAVAVFSPLSDASVDALGSSSMQTWMSGSPLWAVQFNQPSVGTSVTDLTGGGGNQSGISGTAVVADPGGWTYYGGFNPTVFLPFFDGGV